MMGNTERKKCCLSARAACRMLGVRVNLCECVPAGTLERVNGCVFSIYILNRVSFRVLVLYMGITLGSRTGGWD